MTHLSKIASILLSMLIFAGCGEIPMTDEPTQPEIAGDTIEAPTGAYSDLVEGSNAVILADTPEKLAYYIPETSWKEREMEASDEVCTLSLVTASDGLEDQANQFLEGKIEQLNLQAGQYIVAELNGPHWLSNVEVEFAAGSMLDVWVTDGYGLHQYDVGHLRQSGTIAYSEPPICRYLRFACPDDETALQLNNILVSGKPALYQQVLNGLDEDTVILAERNETNPVSVYRIPLMNSIYQLADALLADTNNLSDHQKIMIFMNFISDFYVGSDIRTNDELNCGAYIGACGGYSNLLSALACTQDLPARLYTLGNYPPDTGHAVCEIYYDNAWHMYDPTYGAYYTSTPEDNISPDVLSYEDLNSGKGDSPDITCVVTTPQRLTSEMAYGFLGPAIYEKANPQGVLDGTTPMHYPLAISYADGGTIIDRSQYDTSRQGITFLGATSINYMQDWTIDGLTPGVQYEFVLSADFVGGEVGGDFIANATAEHASITKNAQHTFNSNEPETMEWVIEFVAESDIVKIFLSHNYVGPDYHYIVTNSFELRESQ